MIAIFFLIAGLYMVFKKEIRISSKRIIKGKVAQKVGIIFIIPALLSYVIKLIPEGSLSVIFAYISLASFALAFISIIYFIFFYKDKMNENKTSLEKIESHEILKEQNGVDTINGFFRKHKGKLYIIFIVMLFLAIFYIVYVPFSNKKLLYKMDSDCAKNSLFFTKNKGDVVAWEVLQSKFSVDKNSCFAEFDSGGGIALIYDLTHNKQIALYPANAGKLYPDVPGGEINEVRIEYIRKYEEVKSEIFGYEE